MLHWLQNSQHRCRSGWFRAWLPASPTCFAEMTTLLPQLEPVWKQFTETYDAIRQILGEIPDTLLHWQLGPEANSFGDITRHLANSNFRYASMMELGAVVRDIPKQQYTRTELLELLDRSQLRVREVFEAMSAETLRTTRADSWGPLGPEVEGPLDALWFAHQMVRHSSYHLGQLNYITLLQHD